MTDDTTGTETAGEAHWTDAPHTHAGTDCRGGEGCPAAPTAARANRDPRRSEIEALVGRLLAADDLHCTAECDRWYLNCKCTGFDEHVAHIVQELLDSGLVAPAAPPETRGLGPWTHCRWFDPHPPIPKPGSEVENVRSTGKPGAECATCGEALTLAEAAAPETEGQRCDGTPQGCPIKPCNSPVPCGGCCWCLGGCGMETQPAAEGCSDSPVPEGESEELSESEADSLTARGDGGLAEDYRVPSDRESLGQMVREVWVAWAQEQESPKPSWLVNWDGLAESDREVDRRIGETLYLAGLINGRAEDRRRARAEGGAEALEEAAEDVHEMRCCDLGQVCEYNPIYDAVAKRLRDRAAGMRETGGKGQSPRDALLNAAARLTDMGISARAAELLTEWADQC